MRKITDEEVKELLALTADDITSKQLKKMFARSVKRFEPQYTSDDWFVLPENACSGNKKGITTVSLYVFSRLFTDVHFKDVLGYINTPLTAKIVGKINKLVAAARYNDKITHEQFFYMINVLEWFGGGQLADLINISLTTDLFVLPKEVKEFRDRIFAENAEALAAGDITVSSRVENEIVEMAKKYMKKLPAWENFESGAKLDFDNSYKTMMLVKGPVLNNTTGEWNFLTSNYNDGIKKEEYPIFADSAVAGVMSRAKGVAIGGYTVKKFISTLQEVTAGPKGSDCNTKDTIEIYLDPYFAQTFADMNIMVGDKVVNLDAVNLPKFTGKVVNLFSPMTCKYPAPQLCNKCIGNHAYKMNIEMIGLASTKMGSTMMQKALKAFHSKKVFLYGTTVDDLFG